jgi:putative MFS transporter
MSDNTAGTASERRAWFLVVVAGLGYFVDIYDLLLFGIVRKVSLIDIGVPKEQLLDTGAFLLSWQMGGVLLGGILWGVLGDKRGRLTVLFASILLYSGANIANGFVTTVNGYAALRFIAGIGLAGELGAGITIVSETIPKRMRSIATAIVAGVGICGAVVAALVGAKTGWRVAFYIGGGLGFALLLLRLGAFESGLFAKARAAGVSRGNFFQLFTSRARLVRYLCLILVGVPIWYCVGILVTFSPEIGLALGMSEAPDPGKAIMFNYSGVVVGDFISGYLSHALRSRKKVLLGSMIFTALAVLAYFMTAPLELGSFYILLAVVGAGTGYWAVFMTTVAEGFGTNLRATATTTVPNFVRGMVVPLSSLFAYLKAPVGVVPSALIVGGVVFVAGFLAWLAIGESFGKDLDYLES